MAADNVSGIEHIKIVEVIVCHESNTFQSLKGNIVINCITISFHLPDMLSIDH